MSANSIENIKNDDFLIWLGDEEIVLPPMSEYLLRYDCEICGEEHYFDPGNLPGGPEHCEYCEICGGKLILYDGQ